MIFMARSTATKVARSKWREDTDELYSTYLSYCAYARMIFKARSTPSLGGRGGGRREGAGVLYLSYISENDLHSPEYGHRSWGDEE
jgi:hypothetical protein